MNLYPELVETKDGKQVGGFYSTPGLKQWATVANGGKGIVRGLHYVSATNLLLVVCGNTLTSITQNGVQTVLGTIKSVVGAVSIIDNGTQYFLSDGVNAYVYASGALTVINTLPPNPGITTYQDNLGLVAIRGTNQFYQSNIGDLSTWDALSFSSADSEPSPIMAIISLFRQVWVFKQQSVEIWNNAGLNGFSFQRMEGAYLEIGCISPYSVCQVGDRLIWLGQDDQGQGVIYITNGYAGQRISTHPVEYAMRSYGKISDAVAYSYQQAGHLFYVISFPTGNATWVYDRTTGLWHERGEYINGSYRMHDSSGHALFAGLNIVGSASSTNLYSLDLTYASDDLTPPPPSNPKRWARRWRALQKAANQPVRLQSLRIDMQTGIFNTNLGFSGHLANQVLGTSVDYGYSVFGAAKPIIVSLIGGSLPTGLSLSSSGVLTGVASSPGSYSWQMQAMDSMGDAVYLSDACNITSSLAAALVSWWPMTETSGTRYDKTGTNNLTVFTGTDNGAVTGAPGSGSAWNLGGNNTLSRPAASCVGLDDSTVMEIVSWIDFGPISGAAGDVASKIDLNHVTGYALQVGKDAGPGSNFGAYFAQSNNAVPAIAMTPSVYHMVSGYRNGSIRGITIDAGQENTTQTGVTTSVTSSYDFKIGSVWSYSLYGTPTYIGQTAFFNRNLTTYERTWLYNNGQGQTYASLVGLPT